MSKTSAFLGLLLPCVLLGCGSGRDQSLVDVAQEQIDGSSGNKGKFNVRAGTRTEELPGTARTLVLPSSASGVELSGVDAVGNPLAPVEVQGAVGATTDGIPLWKKQIPNLILNWVPGLISSQISSLNGAQQVLPEGGLRRIVLGRLTLPRTHSGKTFDFSFGEDAIGTARPYLRRETVSVGNQGCGGTLIPQEGPSDDVFPVYPELLETDQNSAHFNIYAKVAPEELDLFRAQSRTIGSVEVTDCQSYCSRVRATEAFTMPNISGIPQNFQIGSEYVCLSDGRCRIRISPVVPSVWETLPVWSSFFTCIDHATEHVNPRTLAETESVTQIEVSPSPGDARVRILPSGVNGNDASVGVMGSLVEFPATQVPPVSN
jgi:hypothetical protein